jgi:CHAT domain-containing protein
MGKGFSKSQEAKLHHKACLAFLDKVLEKILQGKDEAQVMLFLEANLDKLDHNFAKLLRSWGISKRTQGQLRQAKNMAGAINIFSKLIQELRFGSKANNLEIAIRGYKVAAPFLTRNVSPKTWAETQNNMGNAYCNRIYGEQPENLEQALCCYKAALQVYTKEKFPKDWAWTLNLLGTVYHDRLRDNQEKNLEKAICCYKAALQVHTENNFPQYWADINNNLGNAYCQRIQGNKEDNLERSIGCYESALQTYNQDPEKYTKECIITQNNLGNAYSNRIRGNSNENIELAIGYYQAALEICLLEVFPEEWATLQNNLGNAYRHCTQNNKIENLEAAIHYYLDALKVRTRSNFPKDHVLTQFNLGITYLDAQQFDKSYSAFVTAIETVESLRSEIFYGSRKEEDRQRLAEQWNKLYQRMVEVCLELGYYDQAIEYAERSKTRNLVELIFTRDTNTVFPPEIVSQLKQLGDKISRGQYQLQTATADNPTALAQHLQQLRKQRNQLQDSYMPIGYGFNFEKFQETVDDRTAIIEWYITGTQILTFIITRQSPGIKVWASTPADLQALIAWNDEYLPDLKQNRPHWQKQLPNRLKTLAEILHLNEILTLIPKTCHQLILIPHRFLHLFPLHALPLADGTYLLDCDRCRAGLRYAPSCQLLQLTQKQKRSEFNRLVAIQDPEQNLLFATSVVETIRHYFPENPQILVREEATKETLNNAINADFLRLAHCLLFSGHGVFNYESPLQSCLKLANNTRLTLGEIFSMNLSQCSLVTLSACETGLADPTSISDEYISLPSGFLFAGTPRVVCSLWEVSSISTTLLIREFYKNLFENFRMHQNLDFVLALNKAQKWLRELTSEQCEAIVRDEIEPQVQEIIKQLPGKRRRYQASLDAAFKGIRDRQPHPFASPYYWAAFTVTGS